MVYFVQAKNSLIKIGMTGNLRHRLSSLRSEHGDIALVGVIPDASYDSTYHEQFRSCWISGEWFAPEQELLTFIRALPVPVGCRYERVHGRSTHMAHGAPISQNPDPSPYSYQRPLDPVEEAKLAAYMTFLRSDASGTPLESRNTESASPEEIQDWLRGAVARLPQPDQGLRTGAPSQSDSFWGR